MTDACHLDIESYSECNLKDCGVYKYAEDPTTELLCAAYSFGNGPVYLWVPLESIPQEILDFAAERGIPAERFIVQPDVPAAVREHIEAGGEVRAHNAQFERTVLNGTAGMNVGFPHLKIEQMVCTAAKARNHGLPGSLEDGTNALGTRAKNKFGHGVMLQLCRPRTGKDKRYDIAVDWDKYAQLYVYCIDDVEAEKGLDDAVPDLTPSEQAIWRFDQLINDRGIRIDRPAINDAQFLIDQYKAQLEELCLSWTGLKPTQREKLSAWVRGQGYPQLVDMTADSVKQSVKDDACPAHVKNVLKLYSTYGMQAVSKYPTMIEAASSGDRLRGMFMYYGAGTGRWSSMIVQLQNLFRPVIEDTDTAIEMFKFRDLELIRVLY